MAKLINGNGNPAVYANEDSDLLAAIMGNQTSITAIGEQFRADQADANTIEVFDGVIITKEGRRIQLDANQVDLFEIPTGTQGQTNYYIIGYHLYTDTDANQFCEVFVQLMESASDTIPEDTFRGGADDVYISLYRVTQDGLNIDSIDLLLPTISTISKINADLSDVKTSNRTLIDTITSFDNTTDHVYDFSEYNRIEFVILGNYTSATNKFHCVFDFLPSTIEIIRADSGNKTDNIAPAIVSECVVGGEGTRAQITTYIMSTANTFRFVKVVAGGYNITELKIYGLK